MPSPVQFKRHSLSYINATPCAAGLFALCGGVPSGGIIRLLGQRVASGSIISLEFSAISCPSRFRLEAVSRVEGVSGKRGGAEVALDANGSPSHESTML